MKKSKLLFLSLLSLVIIATSCKKDEDDNPNNRFSINGETYSLAKGYLNDGGPTLNSTHGWDVFLVSSGVSIDNFAYSGTGEVIYLDLNNTSNRGLESGTYNWSDSRDDFSIVPGSEFLIDYTFATSSGTTISATGGSVEVTVDDDSDNVTIEFTLTLDNGATAEGYYSGSLQDL